MDVVRKSSKSVLSGPQELEAGRQVCWTAESTDASGLGPQEAAPERWLLPYPKWGLTCYSQAPAPGEAAPTFETSQQPAKLVSS